MGKAYKWLLISALLNIGFFISLDVQKNNYESAIEIYQMQISELKTKNNFNEQFIEALEKENSTLETIVADIDRSYPVIFTHYYEGDGSSSNKVGAKTEDGRRLTTDDFEVNNNGWYTYQGKVVVAAATWEGINSNYGVLAEINDLPRGYHIYHYFDEVKLQIDGAGYDGIVLDTCSASMRDLGEAYQRVDIFIADEKYWFGTKVGIVYE